MERGIWNRIGPLCGLVLAVMFVAVNVYLSVSFEGSYVAPGESAEAVTGYLEANHARMRWLPALLLVATPLLAVFVADLHERLARAVPSASRWLVTTLSAGGLLLGAGFLVTAALTLGATTISTFGDDVQVARALHAVSNNAMVSIIPGVTLLTAAAAALSFRFQALPRWLGGVAIVALLANVAAYWLSVWILWVLGTSIVLLVDPEATSAGPARPAEAQLGSPRGV